MLCVLNNVTTMVDGGHEWIGECIEPFLYKENDFISIKIPTFAFISLSSIYPTFTSAAR